MAWIKVTRHTLPWCKWLDCLMIFHRKRRNQYRRELRCQLWCDHVERWIGFGLLEIKSGELKLTFQHSWLFFWNFFLLQIISQNNGQVLAATTTFTSFSSEKSTGLHIITQLHRWGWYWRFDAIGWFDIATQNDIQTKWNRYRLAVGNTIKIYRIIFSTECYSCSSKNDAIAQLKRKPRSFQYGEINANRRIPWRGEQRLKLRNRNEMCTKKKNKETTFILRYITLFASAQQSHSFALNCFNLLDVSIIF